MLVPLSRPQQAIEGDDDDASLATVAGCDVITQAPQLIAWLSALLPEKTMVLGSYIYIDGKPPYSPKAPAKAPAMTPMGCPPDLSYRIA